jgi:hypothetical protein
MFAPLPIREKRYQNNLNTQNLWYDGMQFSALLTEPAPQNCQHPVLMNIPAPTPVSDSVPGSFDRQSNPR